MSDLTRPEPKIETIEAQDPQSHVFGVSKTVGGRNSNGPEEEKAIHHGALAKEAKTKSPTDGNGSSGLPTAVLPLSYSSLESFLKAHEPDFESTGDIDLLEKLIEHRRQMLRLAGSSLTGTDEDVGFRQMVGHNDIQLACLTGLGDLLRSRFQRLGNLKDCQEALTYHERVIDLTPDGHPDKALRLKNLGATWMRRFQSLGDLEDLKKATECQTKAVDLVPDGHTDKAGCLHSLGLSLFLRFKCLGKVEDLNKAIQFQEHAVVLTPDSHPDMKGRLNNLGVSLFRRFNWLDDSTDLNKAIEYQTKAVKLAAHGPQYASCLGNLGNSLLSRFERFGDLGDLNHAISCQEETAEITPDSHPEKSNHLNNLVNSLTTRFKRLGNLADINRGIELQTQAVNLALEHPNTPALLSNLGNLWFIRYEELDDPHDADQAIKYLTTALDHTPDSHPDTPVRLSTLGLPYLRRFERRGGPADLEKAIQLLAQAVKHPQRHGSDKRLCLDNLGASLFHRFKQQGDHADLNNAIAYLEEAVNLTPDRHPVKPQYLNNLGTLLTRRFDWLGDPLDLDNAVAFQSQSIDLTPENDPNRPACLNNLGNSWFRRFRRLGDPSDLDRAISFQEKASELTQDSHPDRPMRLSSLGSSLLCRFDRLGNVADLDKAVGCHTQADRLTKDGNPDKSLWLSNLGDAWWARHRHTNDPMDLEKAISCRVEALRLTPDGHSYKPGRLNSLGALWHIRYTQLRDRADLENSIQCRTLAVDTTPTSHREMAKRLAALGLSYLTRFSLTDDSKDCEIAYAKFKQGATLSVVDPSAQMTCALEWAAISPMIQFSPLEAYITAFALLPSLVWVGQNTEVQYSTLASVRDLVPESVAWAISVQSYDLALEWLEQGCSVIWKQALQLRTPFDDLAAVNPELAQKLKEAASQLDAARSSISTTEEYSKNIMSLELQARRHRDLARGWEELLAEVRRLPDFHDFLLPRKAQVLKKAAKDGPIVAINAHSTRCDALIILPKTEEIVHVPLPDLSMEKLNQLRQQSTSLRRRSAEPQPARGVTRRQSQDGTPLLKCLWLDVVEPVLNSLFDANKQTSTLLPHVTWFVTEALSFLPLHAAGLCDGQSPNAFDLVVSSYTPTIGALLFAADRAPDHSKGLVAVGQDATPGHSALPHTREELRLIEGYMGPFNFRQLTGPSATVKATLEAMEEHSWVHFACHGTQDRKSPRQSAFSLYDGKLTLEEIVKRAFKNKGLAFLSACETATGNEALPNEAVHLAAGMMTAGYSSVIATLWPIRDADAPIVSAGVYKELTRDGTMDHTKAARALHKAVASLREKVGERAFEKWAPFIHLGV